MTKGARGLLPGLERLSDFPRDGTVYVGTVRSKVASGSIVSMNLPHLPKGYRSITVDDIPGAKTIGQTGQEVPVLADGIVSYTGQPVALIVGPELSRVAEAVSLARIRIAARPACYAGPVYDSDRIVDSRRMETANIDKALAGAAQVVQGEFMVGPHDHYYPEPQGSAAAFDYDKLVVFSSTQWPFHVRDSVASVLGVRQDEVIVRPTILGPHLDGKLWYPSLIASHAALAALLTGRPSLLLLSRSEDFLYTPKRAPTLAYYRAGLDDQGKLVALDTRITIHTGAHAPLVKTIVDRATHAATGAYSCPEHRVSVAAVSSNLPPMGAFAGLGTGAVSFAMERMASDCARASSIDPMTWRELNVLKRGDTCCGTTQKKAPPYSQLVAILEKASDFGRKYASFELIRKRRPDPSVPPGFGIGFAFGPQMGPGDFGKSDRDTPSVELTMHTDSRLSIRTSVVPGSHTTPAIWRSIASLSLGIPEKNISVEQPCTDRVPDTGPATLSRSVAVVGTLLEAACTELASRRFREGLPISVKKMVRRRSSRSMPASPLEGASWGAAAVEVELDPVDASPQVRGIWVAARAGRLLSRTEAERALEHDAFVAISLCLAEYLDVSTASADDSDMRGYRLLRTKDAPPIHIDFVDDDSGPVGIGELAYSLVPPAFANAMTQALDSAWNSLPPVPGGQIVNVAARNAADDAGGIQEDSASTQSGMNLPSTAAEDGTLPPGDSQS